ncbi:MAG: VWA domain-containing protein [bacterium]
MQCGNGPTTSCVTPTGMIEKRVHPKLRDRRRNGRDAASARIATALTVGLILLAIAAAPAAPAQEISLTAPATVPAGSDFGVDSSAEPAKNHLVLVRLPDGKRGAYGYPSRGRPVMLTAPVDAGTYQIEYTIADKLVASKPLAVTAVSATLSAPKELAARQDFEVTFEGPGNKHDMLEIRGPQGEKPRQDYDYANGKKAGTITMTAPERAGDYTILFFTFDKELARIPIHVSGVTASLKGPAQVAMRDDFEVQFEGPGNHGDMVFIRGADGTRHDYDYPHDKQSGTLTMTAPEAAGGYVIVYRSGETVLAEIPLAVLGTEASLKVPATVPAGADFEVGFTGPANRGDMILVELGKDKRGAYGYPQQHEDRVLRLSAPEALGAYHVVYRAGDTELARQPFEVVDVTASLQAPDAVEGGLFFDVAWKADGNRGDRIDLFSATAADPVAWNYPSRGNPLQIQAPAEPGAYELRYRTPAGRVLAKRPITVTPPDPDPGFLQVTAAPSAGFGKGAGVEIILDASGSMLQRIDGKSRIAIAKETLTQLLRQVIPAGTPFAMRVFGHKEADSCRTDLEIPLAPLNPAAATAAVATIKAMNLAKTPIGDSLTKVPQDLAAVTGERVVILLTDGEETCDGDPAAAIRALEASGVAVRVNVIGFAIDDEALRRTFESWAALGNGAYFSAADATQLAEALTRSVRREFSVVDPQGHVVARGRVGEPKISLPAGTYEIRVGEAEAAAAKVEVKAKQIATVELKSPTPR